MSILAPGGARTRRLASLLGGTALVSVAALSMSVTDASAACTTLFTGVVDCLANTTTTNNTNTNGATNPSSDRVQEFNNFTNITSTIAATVDGYGLQLSLTNAGSNSIGVINSGTVTTNQNVNALELNGNGALIGYIGTGTVSTTTAGGGNAMAFTNIGAGGVTVINNGVFSSVSNYGLSIDTTGGSTGTITATGTGTISGGFGGIYAAADGVATVDITSAGAISGGNVSNGIGILAGSGGGNVLVATGSTVSGFDAIIANTSGTGTMTVTTGGAITGTSGVGISTVAVDGATTIDAGHDVTAGSVAIRTFGNGSGLIDINHTAGTIAAGTIGINAVQSGNGAIDISQTGGALNGTTWAVNASTTGSGNVTVSLTGGTVGNVSGNVINTSATTGTTTITSDVNLTSTGRGISAASTTGTININGSGAISGLIHGVEATASGAGNINVTSSGAIVGGAARGIHAQSTGGNVLVATGSTVSGADYGIVAFSNGSGSGTVTVTTGGAVTGTSIVGILTSAVNGTNSVNVGHDVTGGFNAIFSTGNGSGLIDINHTAGTIASGTTGIFAQQTGTGTIDISQTGGALNGTGYAVAAEMQGGGNVIVSLTGGTVGNASGDVIGTIATTGTTTITSNVGLTSTGGHGISATSTTGTINIDGTGAISGQSNGVSASATGAGTVNVTNGGAIVGVTSMGVGAGSWGGNVLVATGSTVSGGIIGIRAVTISSGTVTVTTGGAVTGTSFVGISTSAQNGTTSVNVGHNVTGGSNGIRSYSVGNGLIDINHTAGTIAAGLTGIEAVHDGSGTIDISQTGGALNGATNAVSAATTGSGNLIVSLTGGTVGNASGHAIQTSATTGSTTITSGVALTSTAQDGINATATSGNIAITNSSTVTGATNAVSGSTSGAFNITNTGTLNGNVNVTGSNAASTFANSGFWNAGTGSSQFSGSLNNTGTVNVQNGAAGQVITVAGNYSGNGAYRVDLDAAGNADRMNIGGTANLTGGSVNARFLPGAYVSRNYTILSATGGLGGTTFTGGLTTTALPAGFTASLSYTPTDALLDLAAVLGISGNFSQNQQNVASTLNNYFNNGGALPPGFVTVYGLTGSSLGNALTQLSGEAATGAQQGAFQLGNGYLSLLTDPFSTNRVRADGAIGFAQEPSSGGPSSALPSSVRSAFAAYSKAPPAAYAPRWDVWGAAFGGANQTRGEAVVGSNDIYTRAGGVAAGADYRISPNALIGASLAGGNINWSLTGNGINGGGTSDTFLAGLYGKYNSGPAYLSGALTYASYWTSTNRTVTVAGLDQLKADYSARGFGGRIEAGYRLPVAYGNIVWTPYGAVQGQSFSTPGYGETAVTGSNQFALNFASRIATAWRGELGVRLDKTMPIDNGSQLNLFGRFAYAHDAISNPAAAANFTALGLGAAPFTVYGARPSRDLALTSAGAEWRLANGVSFLAKFDGEFGDRSQTYTATGRLRYTW
ncbi:autotransporter domain-containing protein [Bradyrhizobium sp. JYMT SZCCT0180]|uniref:autotransporter domain-containing protein n=1 Tax=Bradyrhizobium sp. JYMT SZCCT0180 TaxID=2807666 RepID=UPI001BADF93D|nr:autotransporter domain-containing protein [Bradyrhizobium sp. JYMT SZCCT0180]MBR1214240.1 autotransporter domain-containing protein [Bradyrhizobium sp. JYMT SZCCT0180]